MTTLIEAGSLPDVRAPRPPSRHARGQLSLLAGRTSRTAPVAPLSALSRVRGGTYSPTVHVVRFSDGSFAHTDMIRLNPNIDAYSLDHTGTSPRQLCHYREVALSQSPVRAAVLWQAQLAHILANSFPHVTTAELTQRLRAAGYPLGAGAIRAHEAIAATQAAIWHLSNGLELDTQPLDEPVRATARIGARPGARPVARRRGRLDWHTVLPAGETAYLELELPGRPELESFSFVTGPRTGLHEVSVHLERSRDAQTWQQVSHSRLIVDRTRSTEKATVRRLGPGSTLSSASAPAGERGYRFYRLVANGPSDRDGLLDLRDVRLALASGARFRNHERVVYLYDLLLAQASDPTPHREGARLLVGSRTPNGPSEFTPLIVLDGATREEWSLPERVVEPTVPALSH